MKTIILLFILLFVFPYGCVFSQQEKTKVIIDADTGNEVDDLYAISRALIAPELEVIGLNSTQWQYSHWAVENTLEESHKINVEILAYLRMEDIPHPRGAQSRIYDWGQDVAQHSAAAYFIIKEAHKASSSEKLNIIALGALTNVASALLIDPSIADKIVLYWLGSSYNFEKGYWNKIDFNYLMDPHALNVVLDNENLELHITPGNVAVKMKMNREIAAKHLKDKDDLRGFLYKRWVNHMGGGYNDRIIWDLVAIHALLNPDWLKEIEVQTPPENTQRKIFMTREINSDKMEDDFWESMKNYFD
jgi:inosine-uridine nucleoside N-ribohydrolase